MNVREAGGYSAIEVDVFSSGDATTPECRALLFTGTSENEFFCGPDAELDQTADVIASARGPSGANDEYLLRLADALRQMGVVRSFQARSGVGSDGKRRSTSTSTTSSGACWHGRSNATAQQ